MTKARPHLEQWLTTATDAQRTAVDEFIGVLDKTGDSGSVHSVVEVLLDLVTAEYLKRALDLTPLEKVKL